MANKDHVKILKKGVKAWNEWRKVNSGTKPDLSDTNFSDADLIGVDLGVAGLKRADLSCADLIGADLSGADLNEADLRSADLRKANLRDAALDDANLGEADLREAVLRLANLIGANLSRAYLGGADLRQANLIEADLHRADLRRSDLCKADFRQADLMEADLDEAKLIGADLRNAHLRSAHLRNADLRSADLREANVREADLGDANLGDANLGDADLREAELAQANLRGADLIGSDLSRAQLNQTDLENCRMGWTRLGNVDLSQCRGLETVRHHGPSSIGIDTIYRSRGNISEVFLRRAGVPEPFIANMKSLVAAMSPIEYYSCFISYSSKNHEFAERLYADLQVKGVRCWFAPHEGQAGRKLHEQIDAAIRVHEKLLLILSAESMQSEWVKTEIKKAAKRQARERKDVLFPVSLVPFHELSDWECFDADLGKDLAAEVREYLIPDFSRWKKDHGSYQKAFDKLLRDLKTGKTKHTGPDAFSAHA